MKFDGDPLITSLSRLEMEVVIKCADISNVPPAPHCPHTRIDGDDAETLQGYLARKTTHPPLRTTIGP